MKGKSLQKRTVTANRAMKRILEERIARRPNLCESERRLIGNFSKLEDIFEETAAKIYEMRRRCFPIKKIAKAIGKRDRYVAAVIDFKMWRGVGVWQVRDLRAQGMSIKAIAKKLRISDRIVSSVLKGGKRQ